MITSIQRPKCGATLELTDSQRDEFVQQVRDEEFEKEIEELKKTTKEAMREVLKAFMETNGSLFEVERQDPQSEEARKDALGFIELYYSFVAYHQKVNNYKGDLKSFIKKNMTVQDIKQRLKNGVFIANRLRGKAIYDMCHKYNMRWENFNWVNAFRHKKEADAIFEEVEKYPGDYSEKIYAWAHKSNRNPRKADKIK